MLLCASHAADPYADSAVGSVPARSMADDASVFQWRAVPPALVGDEVGTLELRLLLPKGFLVYQDSLRVQVRDAGTLSVGAPQLPAGHPVAVVDPDHPVRNVVEREVVIRLELAATADTAIGLTALELQVDHQGCFEGSCLPPESREIRVYVPVRDPDSEPATCPVSDD